MQKKLTLRVLILRAFVKLCQFFSKGLLFGFIFIYGMKKLMYLQKIHTFFRTHTFDGDCRSSNNNVVVVVIRGSVDQWCERWSTSIRVERLLPVGT